MYDNLTNEELVELAQKGDKKAKDLLFTNNEKLMHLVIQRYKMPHYTYYQDLVSYAQFGFSKAVNTFDVDKGIKFNTYAGYIMSNEIGMCFRQLNKFQHDEVSYDNYFSTKDDDIEFIDTFESEELTPEEMVLKKEIYGELYEMIDALPKREREIIKLIYFKGEKQREISKMFKISQPQVSRSMKSAIEKLKRKLVEKGLNYEF